MEITAHQAGFGDLVVFEPSSYDDARGELFEAWNQSVFVDAVGSGYQFVQDNQSRSRRGVVRGLHYQLPNPQGKLVRSIVGAVFNVAVDIRRSSATFGSWWGTELSAQNRKQVWIPPGYAHGILALTESAEIIYKVTAFHAPGCGRAIRWDDPAIGIEWPLAGTAPLVSNKDRNAHLLRDAEIYD